MDEAAALVPSPATQDTIMPLVLDRLARGESLHSISRTPGFPPRMTLSDWCASERWAVHSARAREDGLHGMAEDCIQIADGPGDPHDKRVRIDTRIRLLGKWMPAIYGDRLELRGDLGLLIAFADMRRKEEEAEVIDTTGADVPHVAAPDGGDSVR